MNELIKSDSVMSRPNALQVHENELFNAVNISVTKCFADLNREVPPQNNMNYLVNEVTNSILNKFPGLRLQEIPVCFAKGIRGEYGEFYGLSVISFEQFIEGYIHSPERQEAAKTHYKQLEQKTEPTAYEKFDTAKHLTIEAFMTVKNNGQPMITGATVYAFLDQIGLIHKDYKKGMYKPATDELIKDYEREIGLCMEIIKRRHLTARLESLNENLAKDSITQSQHEEILRVGKRLILVNLMRDWMIEEVNVEELIEYHRSQYKAK